MPGGSCRCALEMADCTSCAAERAGRGHVVYAGDGRELLLERRGDRRGHRLRVRAGQRGRDLDRREVDVRQIAYGKQPIAHNAEDQDGRHNERRGYGATYKWLGDVHLPPPSPACAPTWAPTWAMATGF